MPSRGADGKLVFKIVYWGSSLSGKTTAVKWMFDKEGMATGKMQSIVDPTGRTLFFDRMTAGVGGVTMQVYTCAGQRRHKFQRKTILNGADGIIFVWDAQKEQLEENLWSLDELIGHLGNKLGKSIPFLVQINKMDLPNLTPRTEIEQYFKERGLGTIINPHGIEMPLQIYETVAIQGKNIKRSFQQVARDAVLKFFLRMKAAKKS
ncbi:MAG: GTP-binding protein [Candidatus Helarchaeota archaeon]